MSPGTSGSPPGSYEGPAGIGRLPLRPHPPDERDGPDRGGAPLDLPGRDGCVVLGAVESQIDVDVPRERIERRAPSEEPALEARGVTHRVGDGVPVTGRRLGLRSVGPELRHDAEEVRPRDDLGGIRLPGDRVLRPALAVVRAERVVAVRARRDVNRGGIGRIERARLANDLDEPVLHLRTEPRHGAGIVVRQGRRLALHREGSDLPPLRADVRLHAGGQDDAVLRGGDRKIDGLPSLGRLQRRAGVVEHEGLVGRPVVGGVGVVVGFVRAVVRPLRMIA